VEKVLPAQAQPARPFDQELIKSFLGGRELASSQLLSSRNNNANYHFTDSEGTAYVLRLASEAQIEKEKFAMRLVADFVPVPKWLEEGKGFLILPFIKGEPLSQCPENAYDAAVTLSAIASVHFDLPGQIKPAGNIAPWPFKGLRGFYDLMLNHKTVLDWIGKKRAVRIEGMLIQYGPLLAEIGKESQLVHGDFNPTNILIEDGKVSAVLDWEYAMSGSPYMDIGNLLRTLDESLCKDVYSGLVDGGLNPTAAWLERAKLFDMTSQMVFITRAVSDGFKQKCLAKIDEYLNFLDPE
jgi:Ser/Thr protein kinase RdoA (MazF antagonist)